MERLVQIRAKPHFQNHQAPDPHTVVTLATHVLFENGLDRRFPEVASLQSPRFEQHLLRRSLADGKEILGLESLDDQIGNFDSLSWADQEALLLQTLTDLEAPDAEMTQLLEAWRDGSLEDLATELSGDFDEFPELETALISARNRRWAATLEELLRRPGRYLVVVGALHLVGEDSVVELLSARGLDVSFVDRP